jgi:two-component system cell cycle sensor histidine kinase/response regulator CckA
MRERDGNRVLKPLAELKLLIVEDDDAVRSLATRVLLQEGHAVLGVHTLQEAREVLEEQGDSFDLVIADVVLPDGWAGELVSLVPPNRLLLTSGYDLADLVASGDVREAAIFLPKPFTPAQLLAKVRSVLGRLEGQM